MSGRKSIRGDTKYMRVGGNMHTDAVFLFVAALCSSSISHITLTPVSPQSSRRSFITMSVKRWLWSQECHGNVVPPCMCTHSCIFWCVCVHSRMCVSIFRRPSSRSVVLVFLALEIWRCVTAMTEEVDREEWSQEEWSQEELGGGSSNRQRAKRMTVPSSNLGVRMIMFKPSLGSKACHTTCKTVTEGSRIETHWAAS